MTETQTGVRERPILFSGPLVRAILDGQKSQTRRLVRPQPDGDVIYHEHTDALTGPNPSGWYRERPERYNGHDREYELLPCPYGRPGDRLWVRETWGRLGCERTGRDNPFDESIRCLDCQSCRNAVAYRATNENAVDQGWVEKWRPSIHMPRWASRISLEITDVRVERLQEITEENARAEGVVPGVRLMYRAAFAALWDEINADRATWASNPWVYVISFRRLENRA